MGGIIKLVLIRAKFNSKKLMYAVRYRTMVTDHWSVEETLTWCHNPGEKMNRHVARIPPFTYSFFSKAASISVMISISDNF